jgi:hypothetical protein
MQKLAWYYRRLTGMSASEILWRLWSALRDVADALRVLRGFSPGRNLTFDARSLLEPLRARELCPAPLADRDWSAGKSWLKDLRSAADEVCRNRLSFFDLAQVDLGEPIDWHRDHAAGRTAPLKLVRNIDYRAFEAVGDCKLVWEPNRHHQFVILGRAYRATADENYARALTRQLISWIDANPFGRGMNWRSPLELGIRLINWVWALELIKASEQPDERSLARIAQSIYEHCWEIRRKYSRGSSANNHLIGEAAGVFIACSAFPGLPRATEWRREAAAVLAQELEHQTYGDGCTREHAFGYHLFVAQFFVICKLAAERTGDSFGRSYDERLHKMVDFIVSIMQASRSMPKLGDSDDGYVLDLGERSDDFDAWLAIACLLFGRNEFAPMLDSVPQTAYWLFGSDGVRKLEAQRTRASGYDTTLRSRAFRDSGYYLLQCGRVSDGDQISILFDCAELGYGSIAAHGHADALSLVLRAYGADVLVDPGTYDYFSAPDWRTYFRSTAAHNTLRIDRRDQSCMLGPFLWGRRAHSELLLWNDDGQRVHVRGRHDGYRRLDLPVTHCRTVQLDYGSRKIETVDEVDGEGEHEVELNFHLAADCTVESMRESNFELRVAGRTIRLELDRRLQASVQTGRPGEYSGWVSSGYHRKNPSSTISARAVLSCPVTLRTLIHIP